jgi:hypothetical protein
MQAASADQEAGAGRQVLGCRDRAQAGAICELAGLQQRQPAARRPPLLRRLGPRHLIRRPLEMFTAPRNLVAWAACYVRAAWSYAFSPPPYWVEGSLERLTNIRDGFYPDSYSLQFAHFIFAHECGRFFLNHLSSGPHCQLYFGGQQLAAFDPALQDELDADRFDYCGRSDRGGLRSGRHERDPSSGRHERDPSDEYRSRRACNHWRVGRGAASSGRKDLQI